MRIQGITKFLASRSGKRAVRAHRADIPIHRARGREDELIPKEKEREREGQKEGGTETEEETEREGQERETERETERLANGKTVPVERGWMP